MFNIGDYVTRKSHNNDLVFKIDDILDNTAYLIGANIRLYADSNIEDLVKYEKEIDNEEDYIRDEEILEREDYFYIPGKILHIDSDSDYLNRCLDYYKKRNVWAKGILEKEANMASKINNLLEEYKPDIVVITGHDSFNRKDSDNINSYKNSLYFVNAIKEARKYETSHQKLIIIAGGCQSNYEELIKAGANFASSPKRINIHALDPAIIALRLSLSKTCDDINLKEILENTKYGKDGMGGIMTKGTMYVGYPR